MLDKGKIWLNLCDFECCVRKKADRPLMKQNFFFFETCEICEMETS